MLNKKEHAFVSGKVLEAPERLRRLVVSFIQELRRADLYKVPGIAETIDWSRALTALGEEALDSAIVESTLGVILKNQEDVSRISGPVTRELLERAGG